MPDVLLMMLAVLALFYVGSSHLAAMDEEERAYQDRLAWRRHVNAFAGTNWTPSISAHKALTYAAKHRD